jgi:predicted DNA-binding transcriptional regulator YafY
MPADTKEAVLRHWQLLKQLPQHPPGKTPEQLCSELKMLGYTIGDRQLTRNLGDLSRIFPITCDDSSKPYHWCWMQDASVDLPSVGLSEAVALVLVEETLKSLFQKSLLAPLAPRIQAARTLIAAASASLAAAKVKNPQPGVLNKIRALPRELVLRAPPVKPQVMTGVQEALLFDQQLHIHYQSLQDADARWRKINPRGLLLKGPVTYLLADEVVEDPAAARSIVKQYALHRLKACRLIDNPVQPRAFDIARYIKTQESEPGSRQAVRVKLKISTNLAKLVAETKLSAHQKMTRVGDKVLVEAAVRDTNALRRWILGYGSAIEVLSPASLRTEIAEQVRGAAARY